MIVYSVFDVNRTFRMACELLPNTKWNTLLSFWYYNKNTPMDLLFEHSNNLLFDSGAFSLMNTPEKHDLDNFFKKYKLWVKRLTDFNCVNGFMEMDVGSITGIEQVLEYRAQLQEVSDKIIPVFHSYMGINEFKKMCMEYDYIGIGGIVQGEINKTILPVLNKYAMRHNTKVHALGLGDEKYLRTTPFYSVDSSTYIASRWGGEFKFNKDGSYIQRLKNKQKIHDENKTLRLKNYVAHIKFQDYYNRYWDIRKRRIDIQ